MKRATQFDIVTVFPRMFEGYLGESIIKRAVNKGAVNIQVHDLRVWSTDKHHKVDDTPYGGGAGMVLKVEPLWRCISSLMGDQKQQKQRRIILLSAKGKQFTQQDAKRLSQYRDIILLCGRYEGVDERVANHIADEEFSIGSYVLTGGELPAMVILDAVARLLPDVLGNADSLRTESHSVQGYLEYPQYTKPENFRGWKVPAVLLSGDHKKIEAWRNAHASHPTSIATPIKKRRLVRKVL